MIKTKKQLAQRIALHLLTMNFGLPTAKVGNRMAIMLGKHPNEKNLGGRCRNDIERIIFEHLAYESALELARRYMESGLEPRSALKQAATDNGIEYGDAMGRFVKWAEKELEKE